jgi:hypothetical protein
MDAVLLKGGELDEARFVSTSWIPTPSMMPEIAGWAAALAAGTGCQFILLRRRIPIPSLSATKAIEK